MPIEGINGRQGCRERYPDHDGFPEVASRVFANPLGGLGQWRVSKPYGRVRVERAIGWLAYRLANPCHMEDALMLYEVRTYTLRLGTVAEFEERFAKRLPLREKHSKLGAFWHTEFGPLNQVIHVYLYEDLQQRTTVRAARAQDTARNQLPGGGDLVVSQDSEIRNPAPFMHPLGGRDYATGTVYEMRPSPSARGNIRRYWTGGPTPSL